MWGEVRGPWGEHYGYVQVQPDFTGLGVIFLLVLGALGLAHAYDVVNHILLNPGQYAWVHAFSVYFYYFTVVFPLKVIPVAWDIVTNLTPFENLNYVLAWVTVPVAGLAYLGVLVNLWAMGLRSIGMRPTLVFILPLLSSGIWELGRWLFA